MTPKEVSILLGILRTAYPRFYVDATSASIKESVDVWTVMLSDINFETAKLALQRLIATCKFPPSIAEVRESVAAIQYVPLPDVGDAWSEVNAAIRNYGYYRQSEALASMRETTRMVVQRMGWRELCMSENDMADWAHFLRIYESIENRTKEQRQLPLALRENIAMIGQSMSITDKANSEGGELCQNLTNQ